MEQTTSIIRVEPILVLRNSMKKDEHGRYWLFSVSPAAFSYAKNTETQNRIGMNDSPNNFLRHMQ
jgi:hypothetical protein